MKNLKIIALVCLLAVLSLDSFGKPGKNKFREKPNTHKVYKNQNGGQNGDTGNHSGAVGAPLDGGLLSILGVAGVAYYAARKRKKNSVNP